MQKIVYVALVVKDYDEAIDFYTKKLNFDLIEDTYQPEQNKRWVVVAPKNSNGTTVLLAKASKPEQAPFIGNQTGGRVFLFLATDNFWRDYTEMKKIDIEFVRQPKEQDYGTVAVFKDLYGNLWDLVEFKENHQMSISPEKEKSLHERANMISSAEARGERKNAIKNAINFLKLGVDIETIAKGTELSVEEILELNTEKIDSLD